MPRFPLTVMQALRGDLQVDGTHHNRTPLTRRAAPPEKIKRGLHPLLKLLNHGAVPPASCANGRTPDEAPARLRKALDAMREAGPGGFCVDGGASKDARSGVMCAMTD